MQRSKPRTTSKPLPITPGLILGRALPLQAPPGIGFSTATAPTSSPYIRPPLVTYAGTGHLVTFAPTGAGKGVGPVITNALNFPGTLIVFDPKGEIHDITARHRRTIGPVHRLDLRDGGASMACLNPIDLALLGGTDLAAIGRSMAAELVERGAMERDPFWSSWAETMMTGGIVWLMTDCPPEERCLSRLFDLLTADDVVYEITKMLDNKRVTHRAARAAFVAFLQLPERETRPCVLASTLQHLRLLDSDIVRRCTDATSIDLNALLTGEPMTIYVTVPPARLNAFRPLLRTWFAGLLNAITSRTTLPTCSTLILCDEAASLGRSEALLTATTVLRGYGLQIWSYWQCPAQVSSLYGHDAHTIIDNAGVVQCFGAHNLRAAREFADLVGGITAEEILALGSDEQIVLMEAGRPQRLRRLRYFAEPELDGLHDGAPLQNRHGAAAATSENLTQAGSISR